MIFSLNHITYTKNQNIIPNVNFWTKSFLYSQLLQSEFSQPIIKLHSQRILFYTKIIKHGGIGRYV